MIRSSFSLLNWICCGSCEYYGWFWLPSVGALRLGRYCRHLLGDAGASSEPCLHWPSLLIFLQACPWTSRLLEMYGSYCLMAFLCYRRMVSFAWYPRFYDRPFMALITPNTRCECCHPLHILFTKPGFSLRHSQIRSREATSSQLSLKSAFRPQSAFRGRKHI